MKKTLVTVLGILPFLVFAQVKPSLPKAEKALREGKLDEAKSIIDVTTESAEFMTDKKGQPTKNAAKAWYLKGLIYFAIDTTKKEQFKSLESNPFDVGKASFEKCYALDGGKSKFFVNDPSGLPMLNDQVNALLGNTYYNKAIIGYNEKADPKLVLAYTEKTMYFIPADTAILLYAGGVFAPAAGEYDKGLEMLSRYIKGGGTLPEVYTMMANIYTDQKKDNAGALKIIQEGKAKFPKYKDLRLLELNIYLGEKKFDIAKQMVEKELELDPNKDNYFLYGQLSRELGEMDKAKEAFKKSLELDPKSFDAAAELANLYWADAKKYKDQMGMLGNSKSDMEKLKVLDAKYVEQLKIYIPYIEACEKLSPDDVTVLYSLLNVYSDMDDQPKIARVKKRLKALGEQID